MTHLPLLPLLLLLPMLMLMLVVTRSIPVIRRWRKEFTKLLFLRAEDYYASPRAVLTRAMRFLALAIPLDEAGWAPLLTPEVVRAGPRPEAGLPPLPATMEAMLREFYAPGLAALAESLKGEPDAAEWRAWASK